MLNTLTPLASGGHSASELWCPQRLQCQSFVVLIPPFLWHCHTLSLLMLTEINSTSKSLVDPPVVIWYASHYTLCLLIVVLFWRKVHQNVGFSSLLNQSNFLQPVTQVAEKRKVASTPTTLSSIADSYTQSGLGVTGSSNEATSIISAPILDQNTVACLHQSLGIDAFVSSIRQLTAQMHKDKEV